MSDAERQLTLAELERMPVDPAAPRGHVGPFPELTIREAFARFHTDNPQVYAELVRLARRWQSRGHRRCGIQMLFEVLRWRSGMRTGGDDFRLNNNYASYYARLIMARERELEGLFQLRELHAPGSTNGAAR